MVSSAPLVIWLLQDGKVGHQNQALALVEALKQRLSLQLEVVELPAHPLPGLRVVHSLFGTCALARPHLIIGAGHATHGALLALMLLKRIPGLVVMRPSLPLAWFSRVVAPSHDLAKAVASPRLIPTFGPLCRQALATVTPPATQQVWPRTLILLGGPSRHYRFDQEDLQTHLAHLLAGAPDPEGWCLVESRRTPVGALQQLANGLGLSSQQLMPWRGCPAGWLAAVLAQQPLVWASEDSMSMLFEAASAGCRVGVLPMPRRPGRSRLQHSLDRLVAEGYVLPLSAWLAGEPLLACSQPLAEASRAADQLLPWLLSLRREGQPS